MSKAIVRSLLAVLALCGCCTAWAVDYGDAPNSYSTTIGAGGAAHGVTATLRIGALVDSEADGQPNAAANGDNAAGTNDEDGVTFSPLVAGTNAIFHVSVFNNTGVPARLLGWLDVNGNGVFDVGESALAVVASSASQQVVTLSFAVPGTADIDTGGSTYARFRLSTDAAMTAATPAGAMADGEVEDYQVAVNPPGIAVSITDDRLTVPLGSANSYTVVVQFSGLAGVTRPVTVALDPAAYDVPGSTWACTANAQASCVSGSPLGTAANGVGALAAVAVDLQQGGRLQFTVNATVRPAFGGATINTPVTLNPGETASDSTAVVAALPASAPAAVPTLGQWGLLLLGAAVALLGSRRRGR